MEPRHNAAPLRALPPGVMAAPAGAWTLRGPALQIDQPRAAEPSRAPVKLLLALRGTTELHQHNRRRLTLQPGQFTLVDAAGGVALAAGAFEHVLVALPRTMVESRGGALARGAWRLQGHTGAEALVRDFVTSLGRHAPALQAPALRRSLSVLADLLDSALEGTRGGPAPDLLQRVHALLDLELAELDPSLLAARLRVSRRYLDKSLQACGHTASSLIWERRLQLAARWLHEQPLRPITEICHAVGYKDASHFTRSFRARYGCTPRTWRNASGAHSVMRP